MHNDGAATKKALACVATRYSVDCQALHLYKGQKEVQSVTPHAGRKEGGLQIVLRLLKPVPESLNSARWFIIRKSNCRQNKHHHTLAQRNRPLDPRDIL